MPAPDPPLQVDADLRPEGRQGAAGPQRSRRTGRTTRRWSSPGRRRRCCGRRRWPATRQLGAAFVELADPLRYPAGGLTPDATTEIRRLKARVDAERLPRGADPATHTKLGRGGLVDVEWTVQLLQLRHGAAGAGAAHDPDAAGAGRGPGRRPARRRRRRGAGGGLADRDPGPQRGRAGARPAVATSCPGRGRTWPGWCGWSATRRARDPGQFLDDYRRATRRARAVVERVFYGQGAEG